MSLRTVVANYENVWAKLDTMIQFMPKIFHSVVLKMSYFVYLLDFILSKVEQQIVLIT